MVRTVLWTTFPFFNYDEMKIVADVTNWLSDSLPPLLPPNVEANLHKLALCGHSRGGRTAFSVITHKPDNMSLNFSALIGVDPVMGFPITGQIKPDVLTFKPNSLNLGMPVMVIGTGLGSVSMDGLVKPCVPQGLGHEEVYSECQAPCFHFVTKDYGHMDIIDDNPLDPIGSMAACLCKKGEGGRDPMRRCVGGLVVAFLEAHLEGKNGDLTTIANNPKIAPAVLDPVEWRECS
ncbi:hypothetical protein Sjap_006502 [Stephania japonica]|uniref:Chlorophyllase n=1 Tax=Stephania japonica TaxID=461633 RepID=A0AAP0K7N8_9MAGN